MNAPRPLCLACALPHRERCSHLWAVLKAAADVVLDVQLYFFKTILEGTPSQGVFEINAPNYQWVSNTSDPTVRWQQLPVALPAQLAVLQH